MHEDGSPTGDPEQRRAEDDGPGRVESGSADSSGVPYYVRYQDEPEPRAHRSARWTLAAVLLALYGAMLAYRVLIAGRLEQTALFYVGLPALIAVTIVLVARPRSPGGVTMGALTIGLLLAGPMLGEGVICLVIAAPLFYLVAGIMIFALNRLTRDDGPAGPRALVALPLVAVLALEGVGGLTYLPRDSAGSAERLVDATPGQVAAALGAAPEYGDVESTLLTALPFPAPVEARGGGLQVGARRVVEFRGRPFLGLSAPSTPRGMTLEVVQSEIGADGGRVVFLVTDDTTVARWLDLRQAEATWTAEGGKTRLSWTLSYERTYDPSWYFGPVQEYAMGEAAAYLADTFAAGAVAAGTPAEGGREW
ncbi:hypothetical protein CDO52_24995 [Nocardiopsis gilva YIM 90087]|uniref:Uncharacterized protein n=1 Tax=Nocardiopsis gilva YIM 90087 TaxID=1235441 RepID=A0A223SC32_9ACTN|nr:hypothetical protein [Nocardiopsis gilva]ASU85623.1 hypothetical protein CDO52_24995 [Nocardiopsis gilva YIM 90087]